MACGGRGGPLGAGGAATWRRWYLGACSVPGLPLPGLEPPSRPPGSCPRRQLAGPGQPGRGQGRSPARTRRPTFPGPPSPPPALRASGRRPPNKGGRGALGASETRRGTQISFRSLACPRPTLRPPAPLPCPPGAPPPSQPRRPRPQMSAAPEGAPAHGLPALPPLPAPHMRGPTPWSNWVIRGRLIAGESRPPGSGGTGPVPARPLAAAPAPPLPRRSPRRPPLPTPQALTPPAWTTPRRSTC